MLVAFNARTHKPACIILSYKEDSTSRTAHPTRAGGLPGKSQPRCHCRLGWTAGQSVPDCLCRPMAFDDVANMQLCKCVRGCVRGR